MNVVLTCAAMSAEVGGVCSVDEPQSAQSLCREQETAWAVLPRELCIPLPAVVQFLHSDHCLDLPWKTLAFEAAAIAPSVEEQKEICQKSEKLLKAANFSHFQGLCFISSTWFVPR